MSVNVLEIRKEHPSAVIIYQDDAECVSTGMDALNLAGCGYFREMEVGPSFCAVRFPLDQFNAVLQAYRDFNQQMDSLLNDMVQKGYISKEGEDRPVIVRLSLKISAREFLDRIRAGVQTQTIPCVGIF